MNKYALILAAVLSICGCGHTVRIMDVVSDGCITPLKNTEIEVCDNEITMVSTGTNDMGVSIKHDFDFCLRS